MSDGRSLSPQFDLQTNVLLKIPSCGPPKIFFQMSAAACSNHVCWRQFLNELDFIGQISDQIPRDW